MAATKRKSNLAPMAKAGSAGYDVVIGARKKHFDSHAQAYRHGVSQQNKGVHASFTIVDAATAKKQEYARSGGKRNPKTIYQALVEKLGRAPTNAELKAEVSRIKKEGYELALQKKGKKKRNPESGAIAMREKFTGLPSKGTVTVTEEIHVHEHLAALGELIEMKVKTIKGGLFTIGFAKEQNPKRKGVMTRTKGWIDRRFKALTKIGKGIATTWINPRKANPRGDVLLCCNEEGTQLFIVGGSQKLDLSALGLKEFGTKESVIVGQILTVDYHAKKDFGEGEEEFIYTHRLNEETGGPRPMLRYDTVNEKCFIDGGLYHIEKPLLGVSPGIEN